MLVCFRKPKNIKLNNDADCPICMVTLSNGVISKLICGHKYHKQCIEKWVHISNKLTCPECRQSFELKDCLHNNK